MAIRKTNPLKSYFSRLNKNWESKERIVLRLNDEALGKSTLLALEDSYVSVENHKKKYSTVVTTEAYNKEILEYKNDENNGNKKKDASNVTFELSYEFVSELKYFLFPIISIIFTLFLLVRIYALNHDTYGNPSIALTYLLILISFSTLYLTLHREGYKIPYHQTIYILMAVLAISFVLELYFTPTSTSSITLSIGYTILTSLF